MDIPIVNFSSVHEEQKSVPSSLKVLTWNIEYGRKLDGVLKQLKQVDADILLLQELDIGCGNRSKNCDLPLLIAETLKMNYYIFTKEYLELGINNGEDGIHGNAILSKYPIQNAWSKTFENQPFNWTKYGKLIGKPRTGGRNFTACRIGNLLFYSVHLENMGGPNGRLAQMEELIKDAEEKIQSFGKEIAGIIIGGDLNTLRAGVTRFLPFYFPCPWNKILKHEPTLFAKWIKQRFNMEDSTFGQPTVNHAMGIFQEKLDWLLMRSIDGANLRRGTDVLDGLEESDHKYISCVINTY